ncbi:Hsp33 family molecular chaperone HslO [Tissierella creatinini]|nr:Hsp33 family molecular chaperone HslO [Tissierella creatinini]TJX66689.1 Hsp33 family molecular chaperone HslO [Soehngenia saccharolytica]
MKDYLIRAIDKSGRIRLFVAKTTNLVEESRRIHNTSPTATAAMGRSLTAGAMMGAMMKNEEDKLTIKISGNGPVGKILVVANNLGHVKADIDFPMADVPSRSDGKLDVGRLVGNDGTLTIIMDLGLKKPYVGQSSLVTGEIAEDIANFYMTSEQTPSAVSLGVLVDRDISCIAAGGYIIQLFPGVSDEDISKIENALAKIEPVSAMINKGLTPEEIMNQILGEFDMEVLGKLDLEYRCDCSRDKIEKVIVSLGRKEIEEMIHEDEEVEVVCHFCGTKYQFNKNDLCKLLVDIS